MTPWSECSTDRDLPFVDMIGPITMQERCPRGEQVCRRPELHNFWGEYRRVWAEYTKLRDECARVSYKRNISQDNYNGGWFWQKDNLRYEYQRLCDEYDRVLTDSMRVGNEWLKLRAEHQRVCAECESVLAARKFATTCSRCNTNFVRKTFCPKCKTPRDWPLDNPWGICAHIFVGLFLAISIYLYIFCSSYLIFLTIPFFIFVMIKLNSILLNIAKDASKDCLKWFDLDEILPVFIELRDLLVEQNREVYKRQLENLIDELNKVKEKVLHYEGVLFHFNKEELLSKMKNAQYSIETAPDQNIEKKIAEEENAYLLSTIKKIEEIECLFRAYENMKKCCIANLQLLKMKFLDGNFLFMSEEDPLQKVLDEINILHQIIDRVEKVDFAHLER